MGTSIKYFSNFDRHSRYSPKFARYFYLILQSKQLAVFVLLFTCDCCAAAAAAAAIWAAVNPLA